MCEGENCEDRFNRTSCAECVPDRAFVSGDRAVRCVRVEEGFNRECFRDISCGSACCVGVYVIDVSWGEPRRTQGVLHRSETALTGVSRPRYVEGIG